MRGDAERSPSKRNSTPNLASQIRMAFSSMAWKTGSRSQAIADDLEHIGGGGLLLQRFDRSSVRWRSSLSRRVFSMAMTAWAAKFCDQLDLLVGERPHFLAIDDDGADQLVVLEHRHHENGTMPRSSPSLRRIAAGYGGRPRNRRRGPPVLCAATRPGGPWSPGETGRSRAEFG